MQLDDMRSAFCSAAKAKPLLRRLRSELDIQGLPASRRVARLERWIELLDSADHLFVRQERGHPGGERRRVDASRLVSLDLEKPGDVFLAESRPEIRTAHTVRIFRYAAARSR